MTLWEALSALALPVLFLAPKMYRYVHEPSDDAQGGVKFEFTRTSDQYKVEHLTLDKVLVGAHGKGVSLDDKVRAFAAELKKIVASATSSDAPREGDSAYRKAFWLKLPKEHIGITQGALDVGFELHHATPESVMLALWADKRRTPSLPRYCTHMVGAGALVVNARNELLLVRENYGRWNIPQGRCDPGENVIEGALREVREETGVECDFHDLFIVRELSVSVFGMPDLYFAVWARPKDPDPRVAMQAEELSEYRWVPVTQLKDFVRDNRVREGAPLQAHMLERVQDLFERGY